MRCREVVSDTKNLSIFGLGLGEMARENGGHRFLKTGGAPACSSSVTVETYRIPERLGNGATSAMVRQCVRTLSRERPNPVAYRRLP
jgi:hypothetical protein